MHAFFAALNSFTGILIAAVVFALSVIVIVSSRRGGSGGSMAVDRMEHAVSRTKSLRPGEAMTGWGAFFVVMFLAMLLYDHVIRPDPDRMYHWYFRRAGMQIHQWQGDAVLVIGVMASTYAIILGARLKRRGAMEPEGGAATVTAMQPPPEGVEYPCDTDAEWIAVDRSGRIAIVTTAGDGPMPTAQLLRWDEFEELSRKLLAYPATSDFELFTNVPRPDDFVQFASHGYFSFDWTHGKLGGGSYRMVAKPTKPVTLESRNWPEPLLKMLEACQSDRLDFEDKVLDAPAAFPCCDSDRY